METRKKINVFCMCDFFKRDTKEAEDAASERLAHIPLAFDAGWMGRSLSPIRCSVYV